MGYNAGRKADPRGSRNMPTILPATCQPRRRRAALATWVRRAGHAVVSLSLLLAATAASAAGGDDGPAASTARTDIQKEIIAPYRYLPHPAEAPLPAPFIARAPSPRLRPRLADAVPASSREPRSMSHLNAAILREETKAGNDLVARRLGIGVTRVPLGMGLALAVPTAFYVPVGIGLGFAW